MSNATLSGPLYIFGDSLSDPGNLSDQAAGVLPEDIVDEIGDDGRASNGPVWAETIGGLLGTTSVSYAVAGAEAIGSQTVGDFIDEAGLTDDLTVPASDPALDWDMNLGAQVDRFEDDLAGEDLSNATAVIFIGGNDYGGINLSANPLVVLAQAAQTLAGIISATMNAVDDLAATGMGQIVVTSLPEFTFFPVFNALDSDTQAIADQLSELHNDTLQAAVDEAAANGIPVTFVDIRGITDAIVDDAGSFGLIAPHDLTLTEGDAVDLAQFDEDQVAFWDDLHPSAATHDLIAAYMEVALTGEPILATQGHDSGVLTDGHDLAFGYGGDDTGTGGLGDDVIFGGSGNDVLIGQRGADILAGGADNDLLSGHWGNDVVAGGEGNDILRGGIGADVLVDGLGDDVAHGGSGDDTFIWIEGALIGGDGGDHDQFYGFDGQDTAYIVLSEESYSTYADALESDAPDAALADLGLSLSNVETIVVLEERSALETLSGEDWYAEADLWGLI